jgi:hypothetical protein
MHITIPPFHDHCALSDGTPLVRMIGAMDRPRQIT